MLGTRFAEAFTLANELHHTQVRKGTGVPYISHLMSVAALVLEDGGDEEAAISALLHDAVEDQGGIATLELIRERFGEGVTGAVAALSETAVVPKPPWRSRKLRYLAQLREAPERVLKIAIADKLHNARCTVVDYQVLGNELWNRFKAGQKGTVWFLQAFLALCEERRVQSRHLIELSILVEKMSQLDG